MSRFGTFSLKNIEESINNNKPVNTVRSEHYIWNQFTEFCDSRKYTLGEDQTIIVRLISIINKLLFSSLIFYLLYNLTNITREIVIIYR